MCEFFCFSFFNHDATDKNIIFNPSFESSGQPRSLSAFHRRNQSPFLYKLRGCQLFTQKITANQQFTRDQIKIESDWMCLPYTRELLSVPDPCEHLHPAVRVGTGCTILAMFTPVTLTASKWIRSETLRLLCAWSDRPVTDWSRVNKNWWKEKEPCGQTWRAFLKSHETRNARIFRDQIYLEPVPCEHSLSTYCTSSCIQ